MPKSRMHGVTLLFFHVPSLQCSQLAQRVLYLLCTDLKIVHSVLSSVVPKEPSDKLSLSIVYNLCAKTWLSLEDMELCNLFLPVPASFMQLSLEGVS